MLRPAQLLAVSRTMRPAHREAGILVLVSLLAAVAFYLPFWVQTGPVLGVPFNHDDISVVQRHWDGPLYTVVAKTFYSPDSNVYEWWPNLPSDPVRNYYAAHFPGYPAVIKVLSFPFGYLNGMLVANVIISTLATLALYLFLREFKLSDAPFWVALAFIFLPTRFFLYRYSGSTEPLFLLLLIMSMYFFKREQFIWCGVMGALAVLTRSVGLLLFCVYALLLVWSAVSVVRQSPWSLRIDFPQLLNLAWLGLIPLALVGVGLLFQQQYGDFWAYLHTNATVEPEWPPFRSVSTFSIWSEGSLYAYFLTGAGIALLWRRGHYDMALMSVVFFGPTLFLAHHDITRYILPTAPFAIFVAYERFIGTVPFRAALGVMLLGIYIYGWSALYANQAPLENFQQLQGLLSGP